MKNTTAAILLSSLLLLVSGCGGGGGSPPAPAVTVSGVAAAGSAIVGTVSLKDSAATPKELTFTTTAASGGAFSFEVTGLTKPFMLKVTGVAGTGGSSYTLYSLAADQGTANINPLSNLVLAVAASRGDLENLYGSSDRSRMQNIATSLGQALLEVRATLAPFAQAYPVVATANPITDSYTANGSGLDGMLDLVSITVADSGSATISDSRPSPLAAITENVTTGFITHAVSGTVASSNGLGLAGVVVSAQGASGGKNAVTDGNGKYLISGLANGNYSITLSRSDVHSALLGTGVVSFAPASQAVAVSDTSFAGADFTSNLASYTLSGNLAQLTGGAALPNVAITLIARGSDGNLLTSSDGFFTTTSDANGNYSLSGLPSAFYSVTPSLANFAFALVGAGAGVTADDFSISARDTQLNFTGRPTSDATGGVTGS